MQMKNFNWILVMHVVQSVDIWKRMRIASYFKYIHRYVGQKNKQTCIGKNLVETWTCYKFSFISVQLYGNPLKQAFIKISSTVDICGVCLGRAPSMAAQCGWGHYVTFLPCLYALIARLDDTVGVSFFYPLFKTSAQKVTFFLNNPWVRLVVMAKSEKAASERRKYGAHERKDLRVRWTSRNVTAVGGFGERVNESFPASPLIEPKLMDI